MTKSIVPSWLKSPIPTDEDEKWVVNEKASFFILKLLFPVFS